MSSDHANWIFKKNAQRLWSCQGSSLCSPKPIILQKTWSLPKEKFFECYKPWMQEVWVSPCHPCPWFWIAQVSTESRWQEIWFWLLLYFGAGSGNVVLHKVSRCFLWVKRFCIFLYHLQALINGPSGLWCGWISVDAVCGLLLCIYASM